MRSFERRRIADSSGIEDRDIGPHPRPKQTTILQTETLSGKRRHLANCLFERDRSPLTNIYSEDPSERAVASWMWVRLSENRNLAVRSDHSRRMLEDPFEVRLVDGA